MMHDALDRHIQPRRQTSNVVSVRFTGSIFNPRQGRGGDSCQVSHVTQTQALLLAATTYRPAQLRCIDSGFLYHAAKLTTQSVLAARLCFIPATRPSPNRLFSG